MSLSPAESFKSPFIPDNILIMLLVCPWASFTYPIDISKESILGFRSKSEPFGWLILELLLKRTLAILKLIGWILKFIYKTFYSTIVSLIKIKFAKNFKNFTIIYIDRHVKAFLITSSEFE